MADITFEIKKTIGVLSERSNGWKKELNLISWNGNDPKYDIREWSSDHKLMGKGVTLTEDELLALKPLLINVESIRDLTQGDNCDDNSSILNELAKISADLKLMAAKSKLRPYHVQTSPGWIYKNDIKIHYLYDYVPTYQHDYTNKSEDAVSISNDLLEYKNLAEPYHTEFTMSLLNGIIELAKEIDKEYIALIGIPSSSPDKISPIIKSIEMLSSLAKEIKLVYPSFDKRILNFSWLIKRKSKIQSLHKGGTRNSETIEKSLSCGSFNHDNETAYLILDDICTTGSSMQAVTNLLSKHKVPESSIYRLVLGSTTEKSDNV